MQSNEFGCCFSFSLLFVVHEWLVTSDPILWVTRTTWSKHEPKRHSANETEKDIHIHAYVHIDTNTRTHIHMHGIRRMRCQWYVQQFSSQQFYTQHKSTSSSTDQHQHNIKKKNCTKQKSNEKHCSLFFSRVSINFVIFLFVLFQTYRLTFFRREEKRERLLKNWIQSQFDSIVLWC